MDNTQLPEIEEDCADYVHCWPEPGTEVFVLGL